MNRSTIVFVILSSTLLLPACAGKSLDVGNANEPIQPAPDPGSSGGQAVATPTNVAVATAACATTNHGTIVPYKTPAELASSLVGQWYSCDPLKPSAMRKSPGIEFFADGRWARMVDDGNGGLHALTGVENEGTWKVYGKDGIYRDPSDTTPGDYPWVYIYTATGGFTPVSMGFESAPSRLHTEEATSATQTWLVPLTAR